MSITASGLYGLTLEKMFIDTAAQSLEAETHKGMLVQDAYTPAFDTHDFRNDVTNEVSGTGYSTGGTTITTTEITIGSPAAGQLKWDHDDVSWSGSTITSAMARKSGAFSGTVRTSCGPASPVAFVCVRSLSVVKRESNPHRTISPEQVSNLPPSAARPPLRRSGSYTALQQGRF